MSWPRGHTQDPRCEGGERRRHPRRGPHGGPRSAVAQGSGPGVAGGGKGHQNSALAAETLPVCPRARLGGHLADTEPAVPPEPWLHSPTSMGPDACCPQASHSPQDRMLRCGPQPFHVAGARHQAPGSPKSFPGGPAHGTAPAGLQAARPSCCCFLPAPSQTRALRTCPRRLPGQEHCAQASGRPPTP